MNLKQFSENHMIELTLVDRLKFYLKMFDLLVSLKKEDIIHGDIKPINMAINKSTSNILKRDPMLLDFGLATSSSNKPQPGTSCFSMIGILNMRNKYADYRIDLYAMAISIAVMEGSDSFVCLEFDELKCESRIYNFDTNCVLGLRKNIVSVLQISYKTKKGNTPLQNCTDFGCVIMSIVKENIVEIPHVEDVILKTKSIITQMEKTEQNLVPNRLNIGLRVNQPKKVEEIPESEEMEDILEVKANIDNEVKNRGLEFNLMDYIPKKLNFSESIFTNFMNAKPLAAH